ncbi:MULTISPECIES: hypothetical protein [Empedobacter]|uniref:DUF3887 domain-containing protein n=1 Tax=Empedobacter falsenii TaxID=343874 RepID=A0AAW7DHR0_9FLAO|nr:MULTISPECIES: hypothetical protein [Empedobacter]MDM1550137.1 hypothetical protein [Empedobacter falsenii]
MKNILLLSLFIISINSFGQQNGIKESFQKSTTKLDESSDRKTLKEFVESIYINSLNTFEGEKPSINIDELSVQIKRNSGKFESMKLKDLNDISVGQLKSFEYKKDKTIEALYGRRGELFGMVMIELK